MFSTETIASLVNSRKVRDRQSSAALGLPTRIHDEDCDVEMLDLSDFEEQEDSPLPPYFGQQKLEHVLYAIEIVKLAKLRKFQPHLRTPNFPTQPLILDISW
jgi:hypothetical protein